jgi:hypothetical protein
VATSRLRDGGFKTRCASSIQDLRLFVARKQLEDGNTRQGYSVTRDGVLSLVGRLQGVQDGGLDNQVVR